MKRKDDLKNALRALQVNQPYKLKQPAPWKSPEVTEKEVPQEGAPPIVPSNLEIPQKGLSQEKATHFESAQNQRGEVEPGNSAEKRLIPSETEAPQNEPPCSEIPQQEVSQNVQPPNDRPYSEAPQIEAPEDRPSELAFFKLSHRVFSDPSLQKLSGDCFRLFLWMAAKAWRYPNSEGTVRASVRYIEGGTGMSHANVSRCLKTLKEMDLVRLVHTDFKRGNVWWISPIACPAGGPSGRGIPKKEVPQKEATPNASGAASKSERSYQKLRSEVPRSEGEIKKLRKEKYFQEATKPLVTLPFSSSDEGVSENEYQLAIREFEEAEGEEGRKHLVKEFVDRELSHGFLPPARVLERLVAYDWSRKQNGLRSNAGIASQLESACA